MDEGGGIDAGVKLDAGHKLTSLEPIVVCGGELRGLDGSLSVHDIGSSKGLDLIGLQGAVIVVESLSLVSSRSCQVLVLLEFPIGPA